MVTGGLRAFWLLINIYHINTLYGLLEQCGFEVIRQSIIRRMPVDVQAVADWNAMDHLNQQANFFFSSYTTEVTLVISKKLLFNNCIFLMQW